MTRTQRLLASLLPIGLVLIAAGTLLASAPRPAPARAHARAAPPRGAASTPPHPIIGIGDDKPDLFTDPKFLALRIRNVRYDMSWDALSVSWQRAEVTRWMNLAKKDGLTVLVTIDHSRRVLFQRVAGHSKPVAFSQSRVLPTAKQYIAAFRAFRARFPWVKEFATWDETNYYGEATYNKEALVASYYRGMRSACPSCRILAAEFLDVPAKQAVPMSTWATAFDKALGYQPGYWGFNNYEDANHLSTRARARCCARSPGRSGSPRPAGSSGATGSRTPASRRTPRMRRSSTVSCSHKLAMLSPRVQRVYLYEWDAHSVKDGWDTALVSYTGAVRESYVELAADPLLHGGSAPIARSRSSRRRARDSGPEARAAPRARRGRAAHRRKRRERARRAPPGRAAQRARR